MAIDIRANVTCNLGTLISAEISDDYIQGTGLIKTSGSCVIQGLVPVQPGYPVIFQYTKSGLTRRIPRTMRVLSSFADPFRKITTIQLGCKLTYLQDLKDQVKILPKDDPENENLTQKDAEIITVPLSASFVANQCLAALGLAGSVSLTNQFSIAEFDLSAGYVNVLSDLLVSESYCGYLDSNERLRILNLNYSGGTGPILDATQIIDVSSIGVGDLPGDAVVVSYSTLKLRPPEDEEIVCRNAEPEEEEEELQSEPESSIDTVTTREKGEIVISYSDPTTGETRTAVFSDYKSSYDETIYRVKTFINKDSGEPERRAVVIQKKRYEDRTAASIAGGLASQYLSNGIGFLNFKTTTTTLEKFDYDAYGNENYRSLRKEEPALAGLGLLGLQMVYERAAGPEPPGVVPGFSYAVIARPGDGTIIEYVSIPGFNFRSEETIVRTYTNGNYKSTTTVTYGPWAKSIPGQQSIAESRDSFKSAASVANYIGAALSGRYLIEASSTTERRGGGEQEGPLPEDRINADLAEDEGDPNNGFRVESSSELELITGSALADRRTELSMPLAPDDTFYRLQVSDDPVSYCYYSKKSDAPEKASRYGRTQNRILFGNRNGMNIQTTPENLPSDPFAPFYVLINGIISQYRVNGMSWTMDANGIVASTDALFWGVAGRTE